MKDKYNGKWILENGKPIVERYAGTLTLRGLHYKLVNLGMTNDIRHYKKVVSTMVNARWNGEVNFTDFVDHDRETLGQTNYEETIFEDKVETAKRQIEMWRNGYNKNKWENQPIYPEVFIEKKALIGSFQNACLMNDIALNPCKGYPSLTFLHDAYKRFSEAIDKGKEAVIIYFGDYDPSGEDIPRSIQENLLKMGVEVRVERIALMEHQVIEWKLPPAPTKQGDTRTAKWTGIGQVELDAISPEKLQKMCEDAISKEFDDDLYAELMEEEETERLEFREKLNVDKGD